MRPPSQSFEQLLRLCAVLALASISGTAHAITASCNTSFVDVPTDASYCQAAEWLKQRGVTLGCSDTTHYCPNEFVTRGSMALFLRRLSDVEAPLFRHASQFTSMDTSAYVCQTNSIAIGNYPRIATGVGTASVSASSGAANFTVQVLYSTNGGVNWNFWSDNYLAFNAPAGIFGNGTSVATPTTFAAGQAVTFALAVTSNRPASVSCELTVRLDNSNAVVLQ